MGKADIDWGWDAPGFSFDPDDVDDILDALAIIAGDGAYAAAAQLLGMGMDIGVDVVEQANEAAIRYARQLGADLVTGITDTTRAGVRDLVAQALEEGWSNDQLADSLGSAYDFSDDRAEMIARTETAYADVGGNLETYSQAGVEKKRWLLGPNSCDVCAGNADDGDIPMDDLFSSGSFAPPEHPNCTCDLLPVLDDDQ